MYCLALAYLCYSYAMSRDWQLFLWIDFDMLCMLGVAEILSLMFAVLLCDIDPLYYFLFTFMFFSSFWALIKIDFTSSQNRFVFKVQHFSTTKYLLSQREVTVVYAYAAYNYAKYFFNCFVFLCFDYFLKIKFFQAKLIDRILTKTKYFELNFC